MATSRGSNGALSCRDDHGWRRGRNLCPLPLQTTNDYSEIGSLNEEEILPPAVTGVVFKMAAHSSTSWTGLRHGNGRDVGQTRATIPLIRKDQPKPIFWRLLNISVCRKGIVLLCPSSQLNCWLDHCSERSRRNWRRPEALNPFRKRESTSTLK
jgi:hypothetical protein